MALYGKPLIEEQEKLLLSKRFLMPSEIRQMLRYVKILGNLL
jgi:hypothetical protein